MASVVAAIVALNVIVVVGYLLNSQADAWDAKEFIEEKRDVVFNVTVETVNYSTIYRDDYPAVLAHKRLQEQMDELLHLLL